MKQRSSILFGILFLLTGPAVACSCFGPSTFCGVLDPNGPNPEWYVPDAIVLAVKLGDYQHGMDVKIVTSFTGELVTDEVVRVWGDCGNLCRHYPQTWAVGDTVLWSLKLTDLAGNFLCPAGIEYEVEGDYMISICGVYFLNYSQGFVSGPITLESVQTMSVDDFEQLVYGCLSTGVEEPATAADLQVLQLPEGPVLSLTTGTSVQLRIMDATGRLLFATNWDGSSLPLDGLPHGAYIVAILDEKGSLVKKVPIF